MSDPIWQLGDWQQGYDEGRRVGVKTALDERDTLRKQLDEATEVIKEMRYACTDKSEAMADAWLKANTV